MKLAFISLLDILPWGGSEALWFETAKLAIKQDHQVLTSTFQWEHTPETILELSRMGAETVFRKGYNPAIKERLLRRLKTFFFKEPSEIKAVKKFGPDVIVINQAGAYDVLHNKDLVAYLLQTTTPFYIICNGYQEDRVLAQEDRSVILRLFKKASCVFMISKSQLSTIAKQLVHPLTDARIINNPVNLRDAKPLKLPAFRTIYFASVASLNVDLKGQDIALEALSAEKWKKRNWQFNIYGSGPHKKYLEELVHYFGLEQKVFFKGHVKDMNALWQENHVLLLSSRIESGPMVLTEAMLCGRPVVATRVGKVPEIVQHGYNGYIAEAATVRLFDEALEQAWQDKESWDQVGKRAHESAMEAIDLHAPSTFLNTLLCREQVAATHLT